MRTNKVVWWIVGILMAANGAGVVTISGRQNRDSEERQNVSDHSERQGGERDRSYAIGLWGDLPYNATQASIGVPNLIADMNRQDLAFTVHDGDLKSGSERMHGCGLHAGPGVSQQPSGTGHVHAG